VVPFVGKLIKLQASDWEKAAVSCEQNCARIRRNISTQNMRPHDIAKYTDFLFFTPETSPPIKSVFLVMHSVLSLEGKRMGKRAI
jgi:hypothetical protein